MSFDLLSLSEPLLKAIAAKGYHKPTPIQTQTIPLILQRKDIMGSAQTGTGKTAGFTLPLLQIIDEQVQQTGKRPIRALILVPTRELAVQVERSVKDYGKYLPLASTTVFGGVRISSQIAKLRQNIDILIATPGRLMDLLDRKKVDLSCVDVFVLDEADRLLDMGFIHDIRKIINTLPAKRQNVLFSATFSKRVFQLSEKLLNNPIKVEITSTHATSEHTQQIIYRVDRSKKFDLLCHLMDTESLQQLLVFTRTKRGADELADRLNEQGIRAGAFHGDMNQRARMKALEGFKRGRTDILVATDVASRGIDIDQLPHVINFELPHSAEDYIHRIGRTGRAGNKGCAISLVSADEQKSLREIQKLTRCELPMNTVAGYEPVEKKKQGNVFAKNKNFFARNPKKKHFQRPKKRA